MSETVYYSALSKSRQTTSDFTAFKDATEATSSFVPINICDVFKHHDFQKVVVLSATSQLMDDVSNRLQDVRIAPGVHFGSCVARNTHVFCSPELPCAVLFLDTKDRRWALVKTSDMTALHDNKEFRVNCSVANVVAAFDDDNFRGVTHSQVLERLKSDLTEYDLHGAIQKNSSNTGYFINRTMCAFTKSIPESKD